MDIRSLEAFTAVAEALSFSSGADRLYISQSAASKYVRHLETELGVCLFDRTHRQIRLTPAGERMLPQAKALLSQYRSLLESVREETVLHIAMLPVADSYGFAQLLADFSAGMPGQPLRLEERQNLPILRLLEENQLDGAFCRVLPPYPESRDCVLFRREELVLLVTDEGQAESRVDLSRYRDRRFLFLEKAPAFGKQAWHCAGRPDSARTSAIPAPPGEISPGWFGKAPASRCWRRGSPCSACRRGFVCCT